MKTYSKIFFAAVAAAFGFASCAQEELAPSENPQDNLVTVHFGAESDIVGTKATLTTEDEKTFKAAWEDGDVLSVEYSYNYGDVTETTAEWKGAYFEAQLAGDTGVWIYDAVYPAPASDMKADFGSSRKQNGNSYNSKYDFMYGSATAENANAGKTSDGEDIVFNMSRQTAIAYFHLTGALDEDVVSAKLSVAGDIACLATSSAELVEYAKGYEFDDSGSNALKEITMTFEDNTAPKASDFKLWFNVLPTIYSKMTLTVETSGHTLTISKTAKDEDDGTYEAGKLYKVVKDVTGKWVAKTTPTPSTKYVLYEDELTDGDYIVVYDGKAMKAEVSSDRLAYSEVTSSENAIETEDKTIIWHISQSGDYWTIYNDGENKYAASTGAKNKAQLLASGTDDKSLWIVTKTSNKATYEFVNKANNTANVNANLRCNGTYGFACYATGIGGALSLYRLVDPAKPSLSIDKASKTWASNETDTFVVNVTVNAEGGDWTVSPTELSWATVAIDKAAGTITVTPNGENTSETANEATLTVSHASDATLTKTISLKQSAAGSVVEESKTYTLMFGTDYNSKKVQDYTSSWKATVDEFTWNLVNWNNNNNGWTYVKAGPKGNTSAHATIATAAMIPEAISTIVITVDSVANGSITSIALKSSGTSDFTSATIIETKSSVTQGEVKFDIASPQRGMYYQLDFTLNNTTGNKGKNGVAQVSKVTYSN